MMVAVGLILLQLLLGYGLACGCFLVGVPLGGWQFWLSFALTLAVAWRHSRRSAFSYLGLCALGLLLTLFTFAYIHIDTTICHLPMARFMEEGWNPIRACTPEAIEAAYAAHGISGIPADQLGFQVLHVLVDPKFTHILAAQLQAATGLFTALAYPLWMLSLALAMLAYRVARELLSSSRLLAVTFAVMLCCNPILTSGSFQGQVDVVTYAATVIAALALASWQRNRSRLTLAVFFAALAIMLVSKFNAIGSALVMLIIALIIGRKERAMWCASGCFLLSLLLLGLFPYWTNAWWFGSPLYPAHTFRAGVVLPDLTGDFVGLNEPARQMGYLARMVYAWVSPKLALWSCAHWYGSSSFEPLWRWNWLVSGEPWPQCLALASALVMLLTRRWNLLLTMAAALFLSFFLLPVKYIGYSRYVAQVHAAVVIVWFVFAAGLPERWRRLASLGCVVVAIVLAVRVGGHFAWQYRLEGVMCRNVELMQRSGRKYLMNPGEYGSWILVVRERLALEGVELGLAPTDRELQEGEEKLGLKFPMRLHAEGFTDVDDPIPLSAKMKLPRPLWR